MQEAVVEERLHEERHAARLEHVLGDVAAARLQVGDVGRLLEDRGDVEEVERDAAFMRDRRKVEGGVGRAAGSGDDRRGILQRLQGDDVARADVAGDELHHLLACRHAEAVADLVGCRRAGRIGQRQADRLGDGRHGVGGELAAAGAGRRTSDLLEELEVVVGHLADRVQADRLEHVDDRHVAALEGAGEDRAAIDEDGGHVEAAHRHHHAGQGLVAAGEADQRVVAVAAHGELDRIGDHLARHQRGLHALVAHGNAVGHRDGDELARRPGGGGNAPLYGLRLAHQGDVAGRRLVPAGSHPDEGLMDLLGRETHRIVIRAVRRPLGPLRHVPAGQLPLIDNTRFHSNPSPGACIEQGSKHSRPAKPRALPQPPFQVLCPPIGRRPDRRQTSRYFMAECRRSG